MHFMNREIIGILVISIAITLISWEYNLNFSQNCLFCNSLKDVDILLNYIVYHMYDGEITINFCFVNVNPYL